MTTADSCTTQLEVLPLDSVKRIKRTKRALMTSPKEERELPEISVRPLKDKNCLSGFECGVPTLDRWAKEKAHKFHGRRRARVHCCLKPETPKPIGFYSLSFLNENTSKIIQTDRDAWGTGVPLIYIDYIAIHSKLQKNGFGTALLMDALEKSYEVSEIISPYGVALRSLNDRTTKFYKEMGFAVAPDENEERSPLMILPIWSVIDLFNE